MRVFAVLYPKKIKNSYSELLRYLKIKKDVNSFLNNIFLYTFLTSFVLGVLMWFLFKFAFWKIFLVVFLASQVSVYMYLSLKVDAQAKFVDKILPDALHLMASNLRAGLTTDKALLSSARPEFGILKDEINNMGKEIATGRNIEDALMDLTKKIKSNKLNKTIMLIVSALKSGGKLSTLLEQTSKNLRDQEFVDQKIRSNIRMYFIFIFSAVGFASPLLFGLSSFLVEVLTNVLGRVELPKTSAINMPISITQSATSVDFIVTYVVVSLITTSILGSFVLGLMNKGKEKEGFRYIPILIIVSLAVFFIVRILVKLMFSDLLLI